MHNIINSVKKNGFYIACGIVFLSFLYFSYKTPIAGDDWGYALNAIQTGPLKMAISYYTSWSGRFFSELFTFLLAPNKWVWNIVNTLIFTGYFVFMYLIINPKKNKILIILLILTGMYAVSADLRMETYVWVTGLAYTVPLIMSLIYFYFVMNDNKYPKLSKIIPNICLFITGMTMENIAATMLLAVIVLNIKYIIENKKISMSLLINLIIIIISFSLMRLSPGSNARLLRDHAEWNELSLWKKFATGYDNFLFQTFISNKFTISIFALSIILLMLFSKKKINNVYRILSILISLLCVFSLFSYIILGKENIFFDHTSWFAFFFWPVFIINSFISLFVGCKDNFKSVFFLFLAGASVIAMCFAPIFGARNTMFFVYYVIIVSGLTVEELDIHKIIYYLCLLLFISLTCLKLGDYCYKYYLVGEAYKERLETIKYYQEHPEDKDVWINRFPIYTAHGADIEPDDVYHLETFRDYFNLPQDYKNIHFGFKE